MIKLNKSPQMKTIYTIVCSILLPFSLFAQSNQDCVNAIPVCQNTYTFATAFSGQGSIVNEINPANSCLSGEVNDVWFSFTVENAGKLRFTIAPNVATDDYNWALFDITGKACSDIFTTNLEVACNVSTDVLGANNDANGRTGANSNPPFYGDLGFVFPAFTGDITVAAGKTYVLNVSNQTGSTNGFSIDFGNSTATLFNPATPAFSFITPVTCGDDELIVHFNKPILCDSLQPSDFLLGGYSVTNISSNDCNVLNKNSSATFTLTLSNPIVNSGSFALNLVGNIVDACGNTSNSDVVNFNVAPITALAGNDFTFCTGDDIFIQLGDLTASYPNNLNFQWTSSSPVVQNAISNSSSSVPMITLTNIPVDTVELVFTVSSGSCIDRDTAYLYFRDCCKDYDAQITSFTNVTCFGASTGDAIATATGSVSGFNTGTFNYQWSNNNTTFSTSGLLANVNYTVTITDPLGCVDTASILLSEPSSPISSSTTGSVLACFGDSTGIINLNVSGATPPYTYNWSNGATSQNLTNLLASNYIVTITDANNCTITNAEQVTQPATPITINGNASTIACGATTGQVNISVNGGGSPYQYAWSNNAISQNISGLMPGTYTVTVSDVYGCNVPKAFTVNTLTNLSATTTSTNTACSSSSTGSATVIATGGLSPYSYLWSNNATTSTINNLSLGLYTVTITDATNCEIVASASVDVDATIIIFGTGNATSCFGGNDGSITTSIVANSTSILSYQWSNTTQTTPNITNLSAGNYTITATDQNGCSASETFTIAQPTTLTASVIATDASCFGGNNGTLSASISGGTAPYTYQWSNGLGIAPSISGVAAGTYTITITDAKNCSTTASATINQPPPIAATLTPNHVACANASTGSISVAPSGGTVPYSYNWDNGIGAIQNPINLTAGTYNLTITDANGCNFTTNTIITQAIGMTVSVTSTVDVSCFGGNDGSISLNIQNGNAPFSFNWTGGIGNIQNPTNLIAGIYNVTITDVNGCLTTTSATITQPLTALTGTTTNDILTCHGNTNGQITVSATGGTAPYSYNWNNGIGAIQNPTSLGAGTYTVTITDFNNCSITKTATISQPTALSATTTGSTLGCFGGNNGTVSVAVSGGTLPYSYVWSNNGGTNSTANNLTVGTYTVTITDGNNCSTTAIANVNQGATLGLVLAPTGVSCNGNTDGSIIATPSGGALPYSYNWSDPTIGNTANAQNLGGGTYSVTLTDANGCTTVNSTNVSEPTGMNFIIANQIPSSCNQNNGLIVVFASGGNAPYTYQWSANANVSGSSNTAVNLGADTYHVTVTDASGCSQSINNIVFNPSPFFQVSAATTSPSCQTDNGQIVITASNNYTYQWSNDNTNNSNTAQNLQAGNYQITVTNNGCDTIINATLNAPNLINVTYQITDANCGQTDGSITATINTGVAPHSFAWNISPDPGNVTTVSNLASGTYFLTITDGNGCTDEDTITVNGTGSLDVQTIINQPTCADLGIITLNPLQGTQPYTYTWSSNANTGNEPLADNLPDGTYSVTVTDAGNCQQDFSFSLSTEGLFDIILDHITDNDCPNEMTGSIDISTTSLSTALNYEWSNQITTEDLTNLPNGNYDLTVTDPFTGCVEIESYSITGPNDFTVEVPEVVTIVAGETVEITATSDADLIYSWAGNDGSIVAGPTINVSPAQTSIYNLSASLINCEPIIYPVTVQVQVDQEILIPEAFSPNDDGINDEFFIYPKAGVEIVSFQIFNRWGEIMHGKESVTPWNGNYRDTEMPNGAYVYHIVYKVAGGEDEMLQGQFLLIR